MSRSAVNAAIFGVAVAATALTAGLVSRLGGDRKAEDVPVVLGLRPSQVSRVVVGSGDKQVELRRERDGSWTAGPGGTPEAETLMRTFEDRIFPLRAFRALSADVTNLELGLAEPEIRFRAETSQGRPQEVLLGAPTFTDGGVYAQRAGDRERVYLVPRQMMDDLRSLVAGRRVDTENDVPERIRQLDQAVKQKEEDAKISWWLRQALDAGAPIPEELR